MWSSALFEFRLQAPTGAVTRRSRISVLLGVHDFKRASHVRLLALGLTLASSNAFGYRPFDSTDADVVQKGKFELEVGPLNSLREGANKSWVAPAIVANYGLHGDRELVVQGKRQTLREGEPDTPSTSLVDTGVFIKQVLRKGVLQEETGLSIATEYGVLLPELHGQNGAGLSLAGIVSQRCAAGTVHLNAAAELNRQHRAEAFLGIIIEGPSNWPVRPVMEFFADQASGSTRVVSRLAGVIWRSKENLSFDVGVRSASAGDQHINELRVGFTWGF